jgi:peptide/nickel transport system substrate-binding protein
LAVLVVLLVLGGVTQAAGKKTLVVGIPADPRGLSPVFACTFLDWVVGYRLYSSLIQADENFQPVPDLAESWEASSDGLTYTFYLRRDATFHDGSPITSEDVKFSVELALKYGSICARGLGTVIDRIETPDPYTVVFHLKAPYPEFLNPYDGIGPHCSSVLKKELYEGTDPLTNPYNFQPVGSGPFKFVEWVKGSHIVLERYEGYFGEGPYIDRIIFRIIPDPMTLAMAFETGEVDWIPFTVPASEVERLNDLPNARVFFHGSPCGVSLILAYNLRQEPFNDVAVRRALTAAIDKQRIVELVYYGGAKVPDSYVIPTPFSEWWYNPEARQIGYDPALAKKILDEAGYTVKEGGWRFHMTLKHTTGYPEHLKVAELIKEDLKKIGVDMRIISLEHAAWHEQVFQRWDFDATLIPFCSGPTPPTLKRFHTENIKRISWANCLGYSNPEYDALFELMISELNKGRRLELVQRMQELLVWDQPASFLLGPLNATAIREGLFTEEPQGVWVLGYLWMHLNKVKPLE